MHFLADPIFYDEAAAHAALEAVVWPAGPLCPHCGAVDRAGRVVGKGARPALWYCRCCRRQFRATAGTLFARSHLPLPVWAQAICLLTAAAPPLSSHRLHQALCCTTATARTLVRRLQATGLALPGYAWHAHGRWPMIAPDDVPAWARGGSRQYRRFVAAALAFDGADATRFRAAWRRAAQWRRALPLAA